MLTALVCEDSSALAKMVTRMLSQESFECISVSSGEDAIVESSKQHFDLIVMDYMLNGDIDGVTAAIQICSMTTESPKIIIYTGRKDEIDQRVRDGLQLPDSTICVLDKLSHNASKKMRMLIHENFLIPSQHLVAKIAQRAISVIFPHINNELDCSPRLELNSHQKS